MFEGNYPCILPMGSIYSKVGGYNLSQTLHKSTNYKQIHSPHSLGLFYKRGNELLELILSYISRWQNHMGHVWPITSKRCTLIRHADQFNLGSVSQPTQLHAIRKGFLVAQISNRKMRNPPRKEPHP